MSNKAFATISDEEVREILADPNPVDNKSKYLVLIEGEWDENSRESFKTFEIIVGRKATYDYIKTFLKSEKESGMIMDLNKSKILVEPEVITERTPRITLSNMLSVYKFMTEMISSGKIVDNDSSFDLDDYYEEPIDDEI
jgi:hypothetical protein